MNIWTFRKVFLFAGLLLGLTACEEGGEGAFATSRSGGGLFGPQNHALPTAALMQGALRIEPPLGYCVDRRSLRDNFALLARCEGLAPDDPDGTEGGVLLFSSGARGWCRRCRSPAAPLPEPRRCTGARWCGGAVT